jgi:hypothetical protein
LHRRACATRAIRIEGCEGIWIESDGCFHPVRSVSDTRLGGVTSMLVTMAKAWPIRELTLSEDASASMSELRSGGGKPSPRPAALSFRDKRVRVEWPRRRTPQVRE